MIGVPFGVWTRVGLGTMYSVGARISQQEGILLVGNTWECPDCRWDDIFNVTR